MNIFSILKNKNFVIENNVLIKYKGKEKIVQIPDGIKQINSSCFKYNENIEKIILPSSVKIINNYAFSDCVNLKEINLENVTYIDNKAFKNCQNLANIKLNNIEMLGHCVFVNTNIKKVILPKTLKTNGSYIFSDCKKLEEVEINSDIYGKAMFDNCNNLKKIKINNNVKLIGINLYLGNTPNLIKIEINNPLYKIKDEMIYSIDGSELICCPPGLSIEKYNMPKETKMLCDYCFAYNSNIKELIFNSNKNIFYGSGIFKNNKIEKINYKNTMYKTLDLTNLYEVENPKIEIILPKSIKYIYMNEENYYNQKLEIILTFNTTKTAIDSELIKKISSYKYCKIQYEKDLEDLIEEGKSFKEINTILKNRER